MEDKAGSEVSVQIWDCQGYRAKEAGHCLVETQEPRGVFVSYDLHAALSNRDLKKSGLSHYVRKPLCFLI